MAKQFSRRTCDGNIACGIPISEHIRMPSNKHEVNQELASSILELTSQFYKEIDPGYHQSRQEKFANGDN